MTLYEELSWRGFVEQTTLADPSDIDKTKFKFYLGIDPSADSLTVGHLAMLLMVRHFVRYGNQAVLLVGGATGMIGDPDGKNKERQLLSPEVVKENCEKISAQYQKLLGHEIIIVNNNDWIKDYGFLNFLRDIGKHVPLRTMLNREFVSTRVKDSGISYAEFSYVLLQAYDFSYLNQHEQVNLQLCGSDQWGNSIAGVDLIRRLYGRQAHVWSAPLIINPLTGIKFGKTEGGALWLDENKTSPTAFYQFWINTPDQAVEQYLKIFTDLSKEEITRIINDQAVNNKKRAAQTILAQNVTTFVHGEAAANRAQVVTEIINGNQSLSDADEAVIETLKHELPSVITKATGKITDALKVSGLASSKSEANRLLTSGAIYLNGTKVDREQFVSSDFSGGRALLRRGKTLKDSALVELG